uniref:Uncharacterized protein n=1 Tax=Magallana gigas TaxID=29159 RepID=A0A8W8NWE3_MAGGI
MASRVDFESNDSDSDESIPEIDICLNLNVRLNQYELLRRKGPSQQIFNEDSDSEPSKLTTKTQRRMKIYLQTWADNAE